MLLLAHLMGKSCFEEENEEEIGLCNNLVYRMARK